jgi:hypothetical protein
MNLSKKDMGTTKYRIFKPSSYSVKQSLMSLPTALLISGIVLSYFSNALFGYGVMYKLALLLLLVGLLLSILSAKEKAKMGEGFWSLGKLEGELAFYFGRIEFEDAIISIEKVELLELECNDYLNKPAGRNRSHGIWNHLLIKLKNGTTIRVQFLQIKPFEIRSNEAELVEYHKTGKLRLLNMISALGISSYADVQVFKAKYGLM